MKRLANKIRQRVNNPVLKLYNESEMKHKAEFIEGPEAASNFERVMHGLFQIPRSETPERPKRDKRRKKISKAR